MRGVTTHCVAFMSDGCELQWRAKAAKGHKSKSKGNTSNKGDLTCVGRELYFIAGWQMCIRVHYKQQPYKSTYQTWNTGPTHLGKHGKQSFFFFLLFFICFFSFFPFFFLFSFYYFLYVCLPPYLFIYFLYKHFSHLILVLCVLYNY